MPRNFHILSDVEQAPLIAALKNELSGLINSYIHNAISIKADTPIGKAMRGFEKLVRKIAEGPKYAQPFLDDGWKRKINIAGSGLIILGLFLAFCIVALFVFLAKNHVLAIAFTIILAVSVAYHRYMHKKEKEKILKLDNATFPPYNKKEIDETIKQIDCLKEGDGDLATFAKTAQYLYIAPFTIYVVDYQKKYHYFIGEAAMLTDGTTFKKIYCVVMPTHERLDMGAYDKHLKIFQNTYNIQDLSSKVYNAFNVPIGSLKMTLSWYLPT